MRDLSKRSGVEEIMDDLDISGDVIGKTLHELDVINRWLGGNAISTIAFKNVMEKNEIHSLADLGCGGGDILMQMASISKKQGHTVHFSGIDANPHIVEYAKDHTSGYPNIEILHQDITDKAFSDEHFDIIHCCLFLHHFSHEQLVQLFKQFKEQARIAIIINDLQRNLLAYYLIKWLTRLFSRSYMVRNDAPLSVARGFHKMELLHILNEAGISNYSLKWKWAFRWRLVIFT